MRTRLAAAALVLLTSPAWAMGPLEQQTPKERIAHVDDLVNTIALAGKVIDAKLKPCLAKAKGRDAAMASSCPGSRYEALLQQLKGSTSKVAKEASAAKAALRKVARDSNWVTYQRALGTPNAALALAGTCEQWVKDDEALEKKGKLCPLKAMGAVAVACGQIATQCQELGRLGNTAERLADALNSAPLQASGSSAPDRPKQPAPTKR
jgi:hypothetical protein